MKTYIVKGKDLLHLLGLAKLYIMFVIYQKQVNPIITNRAMPANQKFVQCQLLSSAHGAHLINTSDGPLVKKE